MVYPYPNLLNDQAQTGEVDVSVELLVLTLLCTVFLLTLGCLTTCILSHVLLNRGPPHPAPHSRRAERSKPKKQLPPPTQSQVEGDGTWHTTRRS